MKNLPFFIDKWRIELCFPYDLRNEKNRNDIVDWLEDGAFLIFHTGAKDLKIDYRKKKL